MDIEQHTTNRRIVSRRWYRKHKHTAPDRTEYYAAYYQANRKRKLNAAKDRQRRLRGLKEYREGVN